MRRTGDLTNEQSTTANSASDGVAPEGRMPPGKSMQEGRMPEKHALDGVTLDGHLVVSDGMLVATENPTCVSGEKGLSRAKEFGARILAFTV